MTPLRPIVVATLLLIAFMGAAFAAPPSLPVPSSPSLPPFPSSGGEGNGTHNGTTGNGTTGNGTAPPPSGNQTSPPPSGNQTIPPPSGNQTTPPSGNHTTPPSGGNGTGVPPPRGNNTTEPAPRLHVRVAGPAVALAGRTYAWDVEVWTDDPAAAGRVALDVFLGVGGTAHVPGWVDVAASNHTYARAQATLDVTDLPGPGSLVVRAASVDEAVAATDSFEVV